MMKMLYKVTGASLGSRFFRLRPHSMQARALTYAADASSVQMIREKVAQGAEDAFYVVNTAAVVRKHALWCDLLPRVKPFYAVKCNPDPHLIETLALLGAGFDCASPAEIQAVMQYEVDVDRIIYANPCKQPSHIRWAEERSVHMYTFDSSDELDKLAALAPGANLVLRLLVDDSHSQCQLGTKFGAALSTVPYLLDYAKARNLNVMGCSFHVGSGCYDVTAYSKAVYDARKVFDIAAEKGMAMSLLDIGGGFPGHDSTMISFHDIASTLNKALERAFPASSSLEIIAEPGRFYAASSHTLAVNVIGRKSATLDNSHPRVQPGVVRTKQFPVRSRHVAESPQTFNYYVNDGLYGSFNCLLYDHAQVTPMVLHQEKRPMFTSSVWGPTCDGLDCISKEILLPYLNIGDWLYFANMGAYTSAASSTFNGFDRPQKHYLNDLNAVIAQEDVTLRDQDIRLVQAI